MLNTIYLYCFVSFEIRIHDLDEMTIFLQKNYRNIIAYHFILKKVISITFISSFKEDKAAISNSICEHRYVL